MNAQPAAIHPTPEQLAAYALGKLQDEELLALYEHLEACESCWQVVSGIPADSFVDLVCSANRPIS